MFAAVLTNAATQRELAEKYRIDRSTIQGICMTAKTGALDALARAVPGRRGHSPEQTELAEARERIVKLERTITEQAMRLHLESFFSLLQKNVLNRRSWTTRDELRNAILTWIKRTYHRRRRQASLGRLTPVEFGAIMNTPAALAAVTTICNLSVQRARAARNLGRFMMMWGYMFIIDRKKDMIVSCGENFASSEVERVIDLHVAVDEVAVVGVADERGGGEVPVASIVSDALRELDVEKLEAFYSKRLARFNSPERFELVSELPRTTTREIRKTELRAMTLR